MEAYLLTKVKHVEGVIKLLDVYAGPGFFAFVLEEPESPVVDLFEHINGCNYLTEEKAANLIRQLVRIVTDVSKAGVFHRDIKDENLLLEPDTEKLYLIDFGSGEELRTSEYHTYSGQFN